MRIRTKLAVGFGIVLTLTTTMGLIVLTNMDQAKPASSYMMRYLDLNNNARSFETKSACNAAGPA